MTTPTYTYGFNPTTNPIDQVRLWVQDTVLFFNPQRNMETMQLADQEIQSYITECSSLYEAAASCAESLAALYASRHQYSKRIGDVHISETYDKLHQNYLEIARNIRKRHASYKPIAPAVNPAALLSTEERGPVIETTDFWTGQFDNMNPVGGADPNVTTLTGF